VSAGPRALALALALAAAPAAAGENAWLAQGRAAVAAARALAPGPGPARNAIVFLGDGLDLTTVTAARILEGQLRGEPGEENLLAFERLPHVALLKTYNTNQQTPDSAGSITAILTGAKTRAAVIGLDESVPRGDAAAARGHELRTLFEEAEQRGLATGIVTTARVTHATPAGAYAHTPERDWECDADLPEPVRALGFPDIARQLVEFPHGDGIDVVLGGGRAQFQTAAETDPEYPALRGQRRDGRDLLAEWKRRHPRGRFLWKRAQLDALAAEPALPVLGLFEPSHMRYEGERAQDPGGEPSLAEMTQRAIALLSREPRGFVLLVEGGRIDHAHHDGNAYRALHEAIAFSDAVAAALRAIRPQETLVVVTADHGHSLAMGGYARRGNPILGLVVETDARGEPEKSPARDAHGLPYTTLGYQNGPGHRAGPGRPDLSRENTQARDFLQEATVPLETETHSGVDVPAYAGGPGAELFHGVQEQSYVYHALVEALGWHAPAPAAP
jgi:alkaline phosphatase